MPPEYTLRRVEELLDSMLPPSETPTEVARSSKNDMKKRELNRKQAKKQNKKGRQFYKNKKDKKELLELLTSIHNPLLHVPETSKTNYQERNLFAPSTSRVKNETITSQGSSRNDFVPIGMFDPPFNLAEPPFKYSYQERNLFAPSTSRVKNETITSHSSSRHDCVPNEMFDPLLNVAEPFKNNYQERNLFAPSTSRVKNETITSQGSSRNGCVPNEMFDPLLDGAELNNDDDQNYHDLFLQLMEKSPPETKYERNLFAPSTSRVKNETITSQGSSRNGCVPNEMFVHAVWGKYPSAAPPSIPTTARRSLYFNLIKSAD
ncbi:hypothetical protein J6590_060118 [Homalodisca vitripennis]|nr:hypothetical protein J6590_060118 [Homalodisca vitripennis]